MPFLREIIPGIGIRAGIWQITESAEELLSLVNLSSLETATYLSFGNQLRKRQWLAYRVLLTHLLAPLPSDIIYDAHGKPFLMSGSHSISVSHAGEFAAAVCRTQHPAGIDIEKIKDRVERVKDRFLQVKELNILTSENRLEQLYVYWSGKEALYKLHGKPDVDFRNDIYIHPFDYLCNTDQYTRATLTVGSLSKDYTLYFQKIGEYMLVVAY